jgi:hypothetical protein
MNSLADGFSVRFFTVAMLAAECTADSFSGSIFSPARLWKCATEPGNTPTNRPLEMRRERYRQTRRQRGAKLDAD